MIFLFLYLLVTIVWSVMAYKEAGFPLAYWICFALSLFWPIFAILVLRNSINAHWRNR